MAILDEGEVVEFGEGELLRRPNGSVIIKVDPRRGSGRIAMGTQELDARSGIRVHKHDNADEVLYIQKGGATAILGDQRVSQNEYRVPVGAVRFQEFGGKLLCPIELPHLQRRPDERLLHLRFGGP